MARREVLVCDSSETCERNATCYKVWRDGERQAWSIDLCDEHAAPLLAILEGAEQVDLPTKPRVRMEVTSLKTTPRTRPLKKG